MSRRQIRAIDTIKHPYSLFPGMAGVPAGLVFQPGRWLRTSWAPSSQSPGRSAEMLCSFETKAPAEGGWMRPRCIPAGPGQQLALAWPSVLASSDSLPSLALQPSLQPCKRLCPPTQSPCSPSLISGQPSDQHWPGPAPPGSPWCRSSPRLGWEGLQPFATRVRLFTFAICSYSVTSGFTAYFSSSH